MGEARLLDVLVRHWVPGRIEQARAALQPPQSMAEAGHDPHKEAQNDWCQRVRCHVTVSFALKRARRREAARATVSTAASTAGTAPVRRTRVRTHPASPRSTATVHVACASGRCAVTTAWISQTPRPSVISRENNLYSA